MLLENVSSTSGSCLRARRERRKKAGSGQRDPVFVDGKNNYRKHASI